MLNKIIIITGASGGLGEIVTGHLAQQGATIAAIARNKDKLKNLQTENKSLPGIIEIFSADITDPVQVNAVFKSIYIKFKRIDALVHLTGGYVGGKPVAETNDVMWREMLNVNLDAAFYCCREAMSSMSGQKFGKIVTISAMSALQPKAKRAAYTVAKSGVIALTRTLAEEGKAVNVQANCIAPGIILTAANQAAMPEADTNQWIRPEQIAETIAFLCSAQADAITGTVIEMP
ncbi:MAG TPA: SDR family oxidoreductase [bacterium]|nr:SDR family oxidoreductase [bacterium]HPN43492.1 SDR family oxidoreductase [bacterium]